MEQKISKETNYGAELCGENKSLQLWTWRHFVLSLVFSELFNDGISSALTSESLTYCKIFQAIYLQKELEWTRCQYCCCLECKKKVIC